MKQAVNVAIRRAGPEDVDQIAAAHLDSIRSIRGTYLPARSCDRLERSGEGRTCTRLARGEAFFIAIGDVHGKSEVLGFSSHRLDGNEHHTAVYVTGKAARRGVGSGLFRMAEASAITAGASSIHLDSSLAAVEFYKANGFEEAGRGGHRLWSGRPMACVFMRKLLRAVGGLGVGQAAAADERRGTPE